MKPGLYLLDVEGTVAPVSLVYEQLFPFARDRFPEFLQQSAADPAVQSDLALLAEENRADADAPRMNSHADALTYLNWLMAQDRKSTALKSLQGRIWKSGFESGALKGTLFPDVPTAFERWNQHARTAIYSSGSVDAQRLLFRFSTFGDITAQIAAYFDTRTGAKTSSASYAAIATAMNVDPAQVIFFSDVIRELDPAREAGLDTRLVVREGNAPVPDANGHTVIGSFDGID